MSGVVYQVRSRTRGHVTTPLVLWALVMAVVLFMLEAGVGSRVSTVWVGVAVTAVLGLYLGWQRRVAAVLVAPLVSWLFAWFPLVVAAMIHDGVGRGLFAGLFLVTIGWIGIALVEMLGLAAVVFVVRLVHAGPRRSEPDVVIYGPEVK